MRRTDRARRFLSLIGALSLLVGAGPARAATFTLINLDGAGEGFNDPTPVTPVGGNDGTTLGQQRIKVFQAAMQIWGTILPSNVTINVEARFDPLTCDANGAVLGSAGAISAVSDFTNAPVPNTWYSIALGNKLAGVDLVPASNDISARFNSSVDDQTCLGTTDWYYGFDHEHGDDEDLLAVVLHELGHGLGFQTFANSATGAWLNNRPDAYGRFLYDNSTGKHWDEMMNNNQRKTSATNTGHLTWDGFYTKNAVPQFLGPSFFVRVDSPPAIAGDKEFGTAEFGAAPPDPAITASVVLADDGTGTASDACEPIVNAGQVAGNIALIDRGTCTFVQKALYAQAAGAVAVIIGNNTTGPAPGMAGNDPTITIPVVSITQSDATAIKGELGGGVIASIGADPLQLSGVDAANRPLMYAPTPLESGSSVSHFDVSATPNLLMEPFISSDLTSNVDLTQYVLVDIGWLATAAAVGDPVPRTHRAWGAPNPFSQSISIWFDMKQAGDARVEVFDVRGALVKELSTAPRPAGLQTISWDGTDRQGHRVAPGVYFWSVRSGGERVTGRMVRIN